MRQVLLLDESSTLRFLLTKNLQMNDYDVIAVDDTAKGIAFLEDCLNTGKTLDGIVFSWPASITEQDRLLLKHLASPEFKHLGIVVLAQTMSDHALQWTNRRQHAALTLLTECNDVPHTMDQLCKDSGERSDFFDLGEDNPVHILFVDDSRSIRKYYDRLLNRHGYTVTTACSVAEAWDMVQHETYDIVISDYFMPDENGYILCQRIRHHPELGHILTAILTGTYLDEAIRDSLNAGAMECMFKEEADELFLARVMSMARMARYQKSVNAERQRLSRILSSVGEGVYGVDIEGKITFINPAALDILGHKPDKMLIDECAHRAIHPMDSNGEPVPRENSALTHAYRDGKTIKSWETHFYHTSGRQIPVDCTIVPLTINDQPEGAVVAFRDVSERKLMEHQLRWQATHDPLTELFNRRYFEEQLDTEVRRLSRSDQNSALLFLDLDRFKHINDTAGHDAGDKLLVTISKQLATRARESDTLARLGGDEFAVILRDIDPATLHQTADAFREILGGQKFTYEMHSFDVQGSIGVAVLNQHTVSASEALSHADVACHIAKRKGRNQSHVYNPDHDEQMTDSIELGWSYRLKEALHFDRFSLLFQPVLAMSDIDLSDLPPEDGELWQTHRLHREKNIYVEALLRLQDKDNTLVAPGAFFSSAERYGLLPDIDTLVVKKTIEVLDEVNAREQNYTLGVNLSAHTLESEAALTNIIDAIKGMTSSKAGLAFEITETDAISCMHSVQRFLEEVKALGCRFLLDRFGAGFSSFPQLRHLPIDYVKIDGQYVNNMARDAIDRAVVTAINDVAHSIGRHTVAPHVENPETMRLLKICGVDFLQGDYIASPMNKDDLLFIHDDEPTICSTAFNFDRLK